MTVSQPISRASAGRIAAGAAWRILVGTSAGALVGVLIGGFGGRLAMLLLRLTSPESAIGVISDDDFEIGVVSQSTFFLLRLTAALGALIGAVYATLRPAIPARLRVPLWTLVWAAVGGAAIVHEDGVDFTLLEPGLLAIGLFVALPAAGAAASALLIERWLRHEPWVGRRFTAALLAAAALGTVAVPVAVTLAAIAIAAALVADRAGAAGVETHRAARVAVPVAIAAVTVVAAVVLVGKSVRILD